MLGFVLQAVVLTRQSRYEEEIRDGLVKCDREMFCEFKGQVRRAVPAFGSKGLGY